ncbi:protein of unknown function [Xenorhabdus doucetiae]|uniref:Rhs family protein n=1 Tax=Xenorhabdus doucetiae TaxID=351671 RepID=A0A068QNS9_9GAMM|nr:protein of unknown function [Xenorhabdus doucetiae]
MTQRQKAGRVVQQGDIRYRYDDNGRLVEKTEQRDGFRPQVWRYRWDTQNQLTHFETPDGSRWRYAYDPFGRRIRKLKVHDGKLTATNLQRWLAGKPDLAPRADAIMGQDYLWSGDRLIEETPIYADGTPVDDQRVRWLYEPGALTPSARFEKGKLHYIVSDHQGTVREMLSEEGVLVWAQRLKTWGKAERFQVIASNNPDYHVNCNLRFCGQYEDEESGLYYNRFRYYSPETAQYISADPLNLAGGFNPYGYVHNPSKWIDPFGLAGCCLAKVDAVDHDYVLTLKRSEYPQTFGHISDAIGNGHADIVTIKRDMTKTNRKLSLKGIPTVKGKDRDEWPMAMFKEGGKNASVRYIDPSDNRGADSSIGSILSDLPNGTRIKIKVIE